MKVETNFPLVDEILESYAGKIGGDFAGYRNHVHRTLNFYRALAGQKADVPAPLLVAAAFHDLGIWTHRTFDYLVPSADLAERFLAARGWSGHLPMVRAVIVEHHKIRAYTGPFASDVEAWRQADLVDVSLGFVRCGLPRETIRAVQQAFPDEGFHWCLVRLAANQFAHDPLHPFPMMHW